MVCLPERAAALVLVRAAAAALRNGGELLGLASGSGLGGGGLAGRGLGSGHRAGHALAGDRGGLLGARLLGEELELTLLGDEAGLTQAVDGLEARGVLLLADDATLVGLHQILLLEATRRAKGGAVKYLGLGTDGEGLSGHCFYTLSRNFSRKLGGFSNFLSAEGTTFFSYHSMKSSRSWVGSN